jgi:diadenosine tetraphosphatase ApaH/serine/threonine PP2A family protein phosphatase
MPQPGDRHPGFTAEPGECWQMIYDKQPQADQLPRGALMDRALVLTPWRPLVAGVWSCPHHLDGLTGLREFGRRRARG